MEECGRRKEEKGGGKRKEGRRRKVEGERRKEEGRGRRKERRKEERRRRKEDGGVWKEEGGKGRRKEERRREEDGGRRKGEGRGRRKEEGWRRKEEVEICYIPQSVRLSAHCASAEVSPHQSCFLLLSDAEEWVHSKTIKIKQHHSLFQLLPKLLCSLLSWSSLHWLTPFHLQDQTKSILHTVCYTVIMILARRI